MSDWLSPLTVEEIKAKCCELNVTLSTTILSLTCSKLAEFLEHLDNGKKAELELLRDKKRLSNNGSSKQKLLETCVEGVSMKKGKLLGNNQNVTMSKPLFMQLP